MLKPFVTTVEAFVSTAQAASEVGLGDDSRTNPPGNAGQFSTKGGPFAVIVIVGAS